MDAAILVTSVSRHFAAGSGEDSEPGCWIYLQEGTPAGMNDSGCRMSPSESQPHFL